jgi:hypothetical protein
MSDMGSYNTQLEIMMQPKNYGEQKNNTGITSGLNFVPVR